MENNEIRFIETEYILTKHGHRIKTLEEKMELLHQDLAGLQAILIHIKWWIAGVGSYYIMEQVGIMPFIEKIIGV